MGKLIVITVSGGTTVSGSAGIILNTTGKTASLDAVGTLANSNVLATYSVEASLLGHTWTPCSGNYTFENTANSVGISGTILTF